MAIKVRDQVKWVTSASELELEADTGEAFLVKDIMVDGAFGMYCTVSIDKTTVGYFRCNPSKLGNHIHFPLIDSEKTTLLRYLWDKGIFKGYPVAEGQKILVKPTASTAIAIMYDIYEPGDISPDMENGSEATEYMLINYGRRTGVTYMQDGDNPINNSVNPSEFPDFPYGNSVPAKTTINIYGILASDVGYVSGSNTNKQRTQYIKMIKEREVLFNEDKDGILMYGEMPSSDGLKIGEGLSLISNYSDVDRRLPYMFEEPLTFGAGEELSVLVNVDITAGSASLIPELAEIALIEKVIRTG